MSRSPISIREFEEIREEIRGLEVEKRRLGRQLGEIMSTSGSFASKTPGFSETEDQIRVADHKLAALRDLLASTDLIRDASRLARGIVGLYSAIVVEGDDGLELRYYICHRSAPPSLHTHMLVTPRAPIALALLGHQVGDTVQVQLPGSERELVIKDLCIVL